MLGLGRPLGEGNDYQLPYSYLENPMDRVAWRATVHEVTESDMTERLPVQETLETWVQSPGQEDTLELYSCLEKSTHRGTWTALGPQRIGHN